MLPVPGRFECAVPSLSVGAGFVRFAPVSSMLGDTVGDFAVFRTGDVRNGDEVDQGQDVGQAEHGAQEEAPTPQNSSLRLRHAHARRIRDCHRAVNGGRDIRRGRTNRRSTPHADP